MDNPFSGLGIALVTPFRADGEIDFDALARLIDYQLAGGADFICVLGTTAETPCLSDSERLAVKQFAVEQIRGRVPVLLGFGSNNTRGLVGEIRAFDFRGVDGILSVCPYYNKPSQEGIFRHYEAIAQATPLPVVVYNVPGRTVTNISAETTLRIARELPNVVAVKEASGRIEQIGQILENKPEGFQVLSGDDSLTYDLVSMGAVGVISVIGNAYPKMFGSMVHAALRNDKKEALTINGRLSRMYHYMAIDGNPAGVKALLSAQGLCGNYLRLPLVPVTDETLHGITAEQAALQFC